MIGYRVDAVPMASNFNHIGALGRIVMRVGAEEV